jgi:hypothetical protein
MGDWPKRRRPAFRDLERGWRQSAFRIGRGANPRRFRTPRHEVRGGTARTGVHEAGLRDNRRWRPSPKSGRPASFGESPRRSSSSWKRQLSPPNHALVPGLQGVGSGRLITRGVNCGAVENRPARFVTEKGIFDSGVAGRPDAFVKAAPPWNVRTLPGGLASTSQTARAFCKQVSTMALPAAPGPAD